MFRITRLSAPVAIAGLALAWAGFAFVPSAPTVSAADPKPVDLTVLREAVDTAGKSGQNVDDIRKALAAFEKALPGLKPGAVPPELQALRDAVDAAARKGENVDEVSKQLLAIETAVAGKGLSKPKPAQPKPQPKPNQPFNPFDLPNNPGVVPFPNVPFPALPGGAGGDAALLMKALELHKKAQELMLKDPNDAQAMKEAQKLMAEAADLLLKAGPGGLGGLGGGGLGGLGGLGGGGFAPLMPELGLGRVGDRARLGIRMEKVTPLLAEQLGLEKNQGVAVAAVIEGTPAEKAGLKVHDIILEFAGKPVSGDTEEFARRVSEVKAGAKVDLVVLRKGKKVEVKGVELPEAPKRPALPVLPGLDPALPNLKPLPLPAVPPVIDNARRLKGFDSTSVSVANGEFAVEAVKGDAKFVLTGTREGGKATLAKVVITEGATITEAASLDEVPAEHRPAVEQLLGAVGGERRRD